MDSESVPVSVYVRPERAAGGLTQRDIESMKAHAARAHAAARRAPRETRYARLVVATGMLHGPPAPRPGACATVHTSALAVVASRATPETRHVRDRRNVADAPDAGRVLSQRAARESDVVYARLMTEQASTRRERRAARAALHNALRRV